MLCLLNHPDIAGDEMPENVESMLHKSILSQCGKNDL